MRKKLVLAVVILICLALISGCSFKIPKMGSFDLTDYIPFLKSEEAAAPQDNQQKETPTRTREDIAKDLNSKIDQMVSKIRSGDWNGAIVTGEETMANEIKQAGPPPLVNGVAFDEFGLEATKEKLYEVLSDAYDFKNHIEGLNPEEKKLFVRTERAHYSIDPADPFKKLALAKALIETGSITEGYNHLAELHASPLNNQDITESYAWALYLMGNKTEAYNIYNTIYGQSQSLLQLYRSAVVLEERDKRLGLVLYRGCVQAGNNLMVIEANASNLSAQSYINRVISDAQKGSDRLLAGGYRIDSQYNLGKVDGIVKSIVQLSQR